MSKISLKPNDSGTGVFTLEAPNSNVDRTLNLPDEAGTVLTNVSDIESQVKTATNATGSAPVYACRAWVNFDGNNTITIRESGNVSSITDVATGFYAVNFTNDIEDTNYTFVANGRIIGFQTLIHTRESFQTNSVEVISTEPGGTNQDADICCVAIFR